MEIKKSQNGSEVAMAIAGRLDTNAATDFGKAIEEALVDGVTAFTLDMADCAYVASSGLRVILNAQKKMNSLQGTMVLKNVVSDVMEVFEMTGFSDILTFE